MWAIFFGFRGFFWRFWVCYGAGAFDTGAFRRAALFLGEDYLVLYPVLWLLCVRGEWVLGLRSIL